MRLMEVLIREVPLWIARWKGCALPVSPSSSLSSETFLARPSPAALRMPLWVGPRDRSHDS